MSQLSSYPSIYALGHKALTHLFDGIVVVEEKIDGSQFSFGIDEGGALHCRSKNAVVDVLDPPKMFAGAVVTAMSLTPRLERGWVYRGEVLATPKHNTLAYDRVPKGNFILFDVMRGPEDYLDPMEKLVVAMHLDLEVVPTFEVPEMTFDALIALAQRVSCLGGAIMEGIVVKNYSQFGPDKKPLIGKYVREAFKEMHSKAWKEANPSKSDVVLSLIDGLRTPARWEKAVQHLRERDALDGSPSDIGPLMKEVQLDILKECKEEIIDALFARAWKDISRGVVNGLPQWYKDRLAESGFAEVEA